ncbi:MAG: glutamine synthetase family protein [bacterium]
MNADAPLDAYLQQHPDTQYLDAFLCDLSCVMRGKRYPIEMAPKVFGEGVMMPGSSFLLAVTGDSLDPQGIGFSDGDPDEVATPIGGTLAPVPWARRRGAQVMLTMRGAGARPPYAFDPRNVLARVIDRFGELNLRPVVAFELEFYLLDEARDDGRLRPPPTPDGRRRADATQVYSVDCVDDFGDYLHEVRDACAQQGVATGAISAEYAPGQFEINLHHSDRPLEAADQCVMFRRAVQRVARKHAMRATFMAKPYAEHAGSGLHLHISLLDQRGDNVFADNAFDDTRRARDGVGDLMLHAIGGLQRSMAEAMAIFAPNINSYRRFVPDSYVPVGPSWGHENRSVAMRVPACAGDAESAARARRIEHRVAGADANPYLTLAALLAGIHHGIRESLAPDAPVAGNAGAQLHPHLPFDPPRAFEACRRGAILRDYFGQKYLDAYSHCKSLEYQAFLRAQSEREREHEREHKHKHERESDLNPTEADWYL